MATTAIRQKLHSYLEVAKDKKIKAIYTLLEKDIETSIAKFAKKSDAELDKKYANYMNQPLGQLDEKRTKKGKQKVTKTKENKEL